MSDKEYKDDEWIRSLKSAAAELRATKAHAPNAEALIRRANAISEQLLLIAQKFDPQNEDGFKQLSDRAAKEARGPGHELAKHLKDATVSELEQHCQSLRALATGFSECATLLRDMEKHPDNRENLENRAHYWMKEIKDTDVLTASYTSLCYLAGAVESANHSHFIGDTSWEQKERDDEIREIMDNPVTIDPQELKDYVRKAVGKYRQTAYNQFDEGIMNTMIDYAALQDDLQPEKTAGDLLMAIATHLLGTPAEKGQPKSQHRR